MDTPDRIARGRRWPRWPEVLDPRMQYPRLGTLLGLLMVIALVPVLSFWNGANGPLGQSIPLFFLVPVLAASALGGRGGGILVSCAALATWDWFFIPPAHRITIASARDVLALVVFLLVALLVGQLSTTARRRTEEALRRARSSEALYDLSLALIAREDVAEALPSLMQRLLKAFDLEACAVLLPEVESGGWRTVAQAGRLPSDLRVEGNRSLGATAARVLASGKECRLGTVARSPGRSERVRRPLLGQERARFLPLQAGARNMGVLELVPHAHERPDPEQERLLATFANGAAIALEQARLAQEERIAMLARESDRLKSALLSSVSHDLRTPLAGIKAAASSLLQQDIHWSEEDRRAFLTDIDAEADRLARLVSNLLDLSRIEAGALRPAYEWEDVGDLINRVVHRLAPRLGDRQVERDLAEPLPAVRLDAVQIEQVLTNLLENAAKYSPPGSPITVRAKVTDGNGDERRLRIAVADRGPGIPAGEREHIFDRFYRIDDQRSRAGGTGMGLAIVKGLVEAHGGRVWVEGEPGAGSTFFVSLPIDPEARTKDVRASGRQPVQPALR